MTTPEELSLLPVGRVLKREDKMKLRVVSPRYYYMCDTCKNNVGGKCCKWEQHSFTVLTLCFNCVAEEINNAEKKLKDEEQRREEVKNRLASVGAIL